MAAAYDRDRETLGYVANYTRVFANRPAVLEAWRVLDVILAAAARCFFSSVLDAVGAEPDVAFQSLDPAVRDALTVGRPIARS